MFHRNCLIYTFSAIAAALILLPVNTIAMDQATKQPVGHSDSLARLNLDSIKPIAAGAITRIPASVYGNCNQYVCHAWSDAEFNELRKKAADQTREEHVANCDTALTSTDEDNKPSVKERFDREGELLDWINALNVIETIYLKHTAPLTMQDCTLINGLITRLDTDVEQPGKFRAELWLWGKRLLTFTEQVVHSHIENNMDKIVLNQHPFLPVYHDFSTEVKNIKKLFAYLATEKKSLQRIAETKGAYSGQPVLDEKEIEHWVDRQKKLPNYQAGRFYIKIWELEFIHFFPEAHNIPNLLQKAIQESQQFQHPIAQAAYLWYKLISIHPFCAAHKRTGKALATIILLRNGYLPPIITEEDAERYTRICLASFDKEDGHIAFIEFCAELIKKTQESYREDIRKKLLENANP